MINDILIILLRTLIGYVLLLGMLRIMGKREIGQLGLFDAVILMSLANITVLGIENFEENSLFWILPVILLTVIQKIVSFITLRFPKLRLIFDGDLSFIIIKGNLQLQEMKKQNYNMDDLMTHLRGQQIRSIKEVEYAVLETNGRLSIFTFEEDHQNTFPFPLVISGKVNQKNLQVLGKSEEWLEKELKKYQTKLEEIYCLTYEDGKLVIIK